MSEVRVNNIVDYGGKGAPTFDNGAVISGVSSLGNQAKIGSNVTITSGGINVSGVTTAATLSGNLTGDVNTGFVTATSAVIGSGVTINAGGLNITGVVTATTFEGSGASLTGVAMTITPLAYNPDVNDSIVTVGTGIGITFDHRIIAGSGNITLSVATNAGAAGTTVENFAVGSDVTIAGRSVSFTPTSALDSSETYHISYPSGAFTNTGGDVSYVGTAYTFGCRTVPTELWMWGENEKGEIGANFVGERSSPIQVPGNNWSSITSNGDAWSAALKTDGTLWTFGGNGDGVLGLNQPTSTEISSPVQIPGTWSKAYAGEDYMIATKADGTLWTWGTNAKGQLGDNSIIKRSSPTQIPGTTWSKPVASNDFAAAIKTDGTLWTWGDNDHGQLGVNSRTYYSSPVQVPGTTWKFLGGHAKVFAAVKTDGTLWSWGNNNAGGLGLNQAEATLYSSPVQVPGTTWKDISGSYNHYIATKTDGTLWAWGNGTNGQLGQNDDEKYSSPVQIAGTWSFATTYLYGSIGVKDDGTLWAWGNGNYGELGNSFVGHRSSPIQIPGTGWDTTGKWKQTFGGAQTVGVIKNL